MEIGGSDSCRYGHNLLSKEKEKDISTSSCLELSHLNFVTFGELSMLLHFSS